MREHWANCITHADDEVDTFVDEYFSEEHRGVLLVAAAGFDPRSRSVALKLQKVLGNRLSAVFVREERPGANQALRDRADANETSLLQSIPGSEVVRIEIFADDGAPVGGRRIAGALSERPIPDEITDVVVDLSALSVGIGFPAARLLLEDCEKNPGRTFHLMIASDPDLDDLIRSDPSDRPSPVRGFAPIARSSDDTEDMELAQIWIPQLAQGRASTLNLIGSQLQVRDFYKICPILPFPAKDPRRADDLVAEYQEQITEEWHVDPRDFLYVSEWNPLDTYRRLSRLKLRFDRTMKGTYLLRMVLSPIGSKVMAAGAMMAAIEHDMAVQYVETESYIYDDSDQANEDPAAMPTEDSASIVHVVLCGPLYASFPSSAAAPGTLPDRDKEDVSA